MGAANFRRPKNMNYYYIPKINWEEDDWVRENLFDWAEFAKEKLEEAGFSAEHGELEWRDGGMALVDVSEIYNILVNGQGFEVRISASLVLYPGYYSHGNLDLIDEVEVWEIDEENFDEYEFDIVVNDESKDEDDIINDLWEKLLSGIEKTVAPLCDKYVTSARFSNGETWYQKVE